MSSSLAIIFHPRPVEVFHLAGTIADDVAKVELLRYSHEQLAEVFRLSWLAGGQQQRRALLAIDAKQPARVVSSRECPARPWRTNSGIHSIGLPRMIAPFWNTRQYFIGTFMVKDSTWMKPRPHSPCLGSHRSTGPELASLGDVARPLGTT
jgi:hypothetical protein